MAHRNRRSTAENFMSDDTKFLVVALVVASIAAIALTAAIVWAVFLADPKPDFEWVDRNGDVCVIYDGDLYCRGEAGK
jgi:hypothetical protein